MHDYDCEDEDEEEDEEEDEDVRLAGARPVARPTHPDFVGIPEELTATVTPAHATATGREWIG